jgi:hypothetical protein
MSALLLALALAAGDEAKQAFDRAALAPCLAQPAWSGRSVRASLVLHEAGGWALGLEAHDLPPGMLRTARECLEAATFAAVDALPVARSTRVLVRTVDGPAPPADRVGELKTRFEQQREGVVACALRLLPSGPVKASVPVTLSLSAAGGVTVEATQPPLLAAVLAHCARGALGAFAPGHARVTVMVEVDGAGTQLRPDGSLGAVCNWGERERHGVDGAFLLQPEACKPGLTCCGGGAAGSGGRCVSAAAGCPQVP